MTDSALDLGEPQQPQKADAYQVLARKYRPKTFSQLIGQDAMVTTLANAIRRDRLAHAFLLTGVRGVGKTSTARLIAKALNCVGPDGEGGPTIDPCGVCEPCRAISEGRHIDVIEMDAASHTGIDDVREIIEGSRYAAVSARYKIYIIDEVHMLSKQAFNGLLKTLEEPPAHVKFLFATTEVNKVPVTVLSRCQRFDLRRIPADRLTEHFAHVAQSEGVEAEPEALALVARAAEGSARDGLSILDQAIAHAGMEGGGVRADAVRQMLGLSDRGAIRDLFGLLLAGDAPAVLDALRRQYEYGVDPQAVLKTLLETVHGATLAKVGSRPDPALSGEEREALAHWGTRLSYPMLHRLWQLLLKGHEEVSSAALPIEACEMALLRIVHAATLPDPGELARKLADGSGQTAAPAAPAVAPAGAPAGASAASAAPRGDMAASPAPALGLEPVALPSDPDALWALLGEHGRHEMQAQVRNHLRPIRFAPPELEISAARPLPADFARDLANELRQITGTSWKIATANAPGGATLREREQQDEEDFRAQVRADPVVAAALEAFPDARIDWDKTKRSA
ncbi:DNA polymerase III subunit gamma/tau [Stakelama saccharophila]|uniref:DNA polymerase III subunit gamma/tau n=1 Tax=Stakelama saccharophila TaxID=3075605 RepID=A0ABZ0B8Z0_9SPHN|nr:DNA polymerase III subunit gamma/tau [Stakelama sp. W311]WNO52779.1 DNA polymerase III subunit gamma/tau [Stakelama sp. W311]